MIMTPFRLIIGPKKEICANLQAYNTKFRSKKLKKLDKLRRRRSRRKATSNLMKVWKD